MASALAEEYQTSSGILRMSVQHGLCPTLSESGMKLSEVLPPGSLHEDGGGQLPTGTNEPRELCPYPSRFGPSTTQLASPDVGPSFSLLLGDRGSGHPALAALPLFSQKTPASLQGSLVFLWDILWSLHLQLRKPSWQK